MADQQVRHDSANNPVLPEVPSVESAIPEDDNWMALLTGIVSATLMTKPSGPWRQHDNEPTPPFVLIYDAMAASLENLPEQLGDGLKALDNCQCGIVDMIYEHGVVKARTALETALARLTTARLISLVDVIHAFTDEDNLKFLKSLKLGALALVQARLEEEQRQSQQDEPEKKR